MHDHGDATLLPGLVDSHVHLVGDSGPGALDRLAAYSEAELDAVATQGLRRQAAAGVTTVRDLGDRSWSTLPRREAQRRGDPSTAHEPRLLVAGPPVTTPRGHCWYLGGEVEGREALRRAVTERVERGVDVVKVMASGGMTTLGTDIFSAQFGVDDLRLLVDLAHAAGLGVTAHAHALAAVHVALDAGVDAVEHCSCFTPEGLRIDRALAERMAAAGVDVCPTFGVDEEAMRRVPPPPQMVEAMRRLGLGPEDAPRIRREMAGTLAAAGDRVLAGVDSGISPVKPHGFVAGAVEDLAAADLLVGDGDLADDLGRLTSVREVVVRGRALATLPA